MSSPTRCKIDAIRSDKLLVSGNTTIKKKDEQTNNIVYTNEKIWIHKITNNINKGMGIDFTTVEAVHAASLVLNFIAEGGRKT
jgi:hypothetical protein